MTCSVNYTFLADVSIRSLYLSESISEDCLEYGFSQAKTFFVNLYL